MEVELVPGRGGQGSGSPGGLKPSPSSSRPRQQQQQCCLDRDHWSVTPLGAKVVGRHARTQPSSLAEGRLPFPPWLSLLQALRGGPRGSPTSRLQALPPRPASFAPRQESEPEVLLPARLGRTRGDGGGGLLSLWRAASWNGLVNQQPLRLTSLQGSRPCSVHSQPSLA